MDLWENPWIAMAFVSLLLALILDANDIVLPLLEEEEGSVNFSSTLLLDSDDTPILDTLSLMSGTLQNFRLCSTMSSFTDDIYFWVRPRSTAWFSRFLLQQYDNDRWLGMFRMTKTAIFNLTELLKPQIEKQNTKYRKAIPVLIRVACTLFKLTNGCSLSICSEFFAIGKSTVCKVLREVVHAINDTLKDEISWPEGDRLQEIQEKFFRLCSLPAVAGAIDGTHIAISKPKIFPVDYFYYKSGGYSMNCQAVVDSEKRFLNLYIGMPGSVNDSRMLRRSSLYHLASHGQLLDQTASMDGHAPFLIGDSGYPLLPWLMVPHRGGRQLSVSEVLFNRKLRKGRSVVENAFGILKQTFRELLVKSDLHLTFLPDVILCCAILHNILLHQSHEDVENLLRRLRYEAEERLVDVSDEVIEDFVLQEESDSDAFSVDDSVEGVVDQDVGRPQQATSYGIAVQKRANLGIYLSTRRHLL